MASTPSSSATSTIWSSASSVSCATVVLMLTRSGACFVVRRRLQPAQPGGRALERALHAARPVVHLAGAVDRHADVLQEPAAGQVGQRVGAFVADDRAVGRQVAADVALLAEDLHHAQDVLAHEDLAAGQADLQARPGRGRRARSVVERQSPRRHSPSMFSRVADVAELAVQVAPHRRFVDHAGGQAAGLAVLRREEALDPAFVLLLAVPRQQARQHGHAARAARDVLPESVERGSLLNRSRCRRWAQAAREPASIRVAVLWKNGSVAACTSAGTPSR